MAHQAGEAVRDRWEKRAGVPPGPSPGPLLSAHAAHSACHEAHKYVLSGFRGNGSTLCRLQAKSHSYEEGQTHL